MGAAAGVKEAWDFLGSGVSPAHVVKAKLPYHSYVAIDEEEVCRKDAATGTYAQDVTLKFGRVCGMCATAGGHNALEYTIQLEENHSEVVRKRYLQPLSLPELTKHGIHVGPHQRDVAVEVEWQGGAKFLAELLRRQGGMYEVRFKGGKREVLSNIPLAHLHPVDADTRVDTSPETLAPDPLWLMDRKIQSDIDVKWPMRRRLQEALELLRSQMRPPGAPPLRGPFVGERAFDSEGFPAHPQPLEDLRIDGAFVDTWGKYAGKVKFSSTYKIGPAYPKNDCWVDLVDAGDPLYFHAALPVYAGMVCLGMYKNPGDNGQGHPEWARASDVALVGIAVYVNGELAEGSFAEPPLEKNALLHYGHESCFFIPGCVSTYMADCTWIGGVFCLAPTDADAEVRDDIYTIMAYHQLLREWSRRPRGTGCPDFGPREIEVQVNVVLSTSYVANLRQVCAGSVKVLLSEKGLAVAYDRLRDIQERRLESAAAHHPKRPRKALSEVTFEDGVETRLVDDSKQPVHAKARPAPMIAREPAVPVVDPGPRALAAEVGREKTFRSALEDKHTAASTTGSPPPPPPPPLEDTGYRTTASRAVPHARGGARSPIMGPEAAYRHLVEPQTAQTVEE